jgi:hypothetical protein
MQYEALADQIESQMKDLRTRQLLSSRLVC